MRVLFYLPVVTPWWFDNIVVHLIRSLAAQVEVHVVVAPVWRNTGIGATQLMGCADLSQVTWHIWDGADPAVFRQNAAADLALMDLIHGIDPHLTLCRSADLDTPATFPGTVRYIMEGGASPLATGGDWVLFQPAPFRSGAMPNLAATDRARLDAMFAPVWDDLCERHPRRRDPAWRAAAGIADDARVIALPLEYENAENFFTRHRTSTDNASLVAEVAAQLPEGWVLAVTDHPLNVRLGDSSRVRAAIAADPARIRLIADRGIAGDATLALAANSDGMIVEHSKSFSAAAYHGIPIQRSPKFASGAWLNPHATREGFFAALAAGTATAPDPDDARTWFAYHLANDVIDPDHPAFDAAELIARIEQPHDPARWEVSLDRLVDIRGRAVAC